MKYLLIKIVIWALLPFALNASENNCNKQYAFLINLSSGKFGFVHDQENFFLRKGTFNFKKHEFSLAADNYFDKNLKVFEGHFPGEGNSIFPGVLHVETMAQASRELTAKLFGKRDLNQLELISVSEVKFTSPILPGMKTRTRVKLVEMENGTLKFQAEIFDAKTKRSYSESTLVFGERNSSNLKIHKLEVETVLTKKDIKDLLPHRDPFLFVDEVKQIVSLRELDSDNFHLNKIVASYHPKVGNPVFPVKVSSEGESPVFHEGLQIEAIAQVTGLLVSDAASAELNPKELAFVLANVSEFKAFGEIKAGDELIIVGRIPRPWRGSFTKRAIIDLEGDVFAKDPATGNLTHISTAKARAMVYKK